MANVDSESSIEAVLCLPLVMSCVFVADGLKNKQPVAVLILEL